MDGGLEEESEKKKTVGASICRYVRGGPQRIFMRVSVRSYPGSHAGREIDRGRGGSLGRV